MEGGAKERGGTQGVQTLGSGDTVPGTDFAGQGRRGHQAEWKKHCSGLNAARIGLPWEEERSAHPIWGSLSPEKA